MNKTALGFLVVMAGLASATIASSQQQRQGPPLAEMAQSFGVSEDAVQACLPQDRPVRGAERPTEAEMQARGAALFACMQAAGSPLTEAQFHEAMTQFQPAPPPPRG